MAAAFVGCQSAPRTTPVSTSSITEDRVAAALGRWPEAAAGGTAIRRPFFATIHAAGKRTTASGVMQFYGPRDFRLIAANELGAVLFDGRVNWAGVTVLRHLPGLDESIVQTLLQDVSRAFEVPEELNGLSGGPGSDKLFLRKTLADTHHYTWTFEGPTGMLRSTDIDLGPFDTLHVEYRTYNARGWPEDVTITRRARLVDVSFTFTDNNVVQRDWRQNSR
jgi:hypothetical protein